MFVEENNVAMRVDANAYQHNSKIIFVQKKPVGL
jgi:hypothetical protein